MSYETRVMSQEIRMVTGLVIPAEAGIQSIYLSVANHHSTHTSNLLPHTSVKSEILL